MTIDIWPQGEDVEESQIEEYELTSSPNDFNILTIFSFIESGSVKIPGFQRNYVWDIKRASKLIESIIIGLPVPQVFLYEEAKNSFLVIDGQQRLMSIYYFMKGRFPRKEKRAELRKVFAQYGAIPDQVLQDDAYFDKFNLKLADIAQGKPNKFSGRNYLTLEEYKSQYDLRTIRNTIVKQNVPTNDDSSIYEMFNRLNTGGINLTSQEIRASLYHSPFYDFLYRINLSDNWRRLLSNAEPDIHMRDIEMLLRSFAMLLAGGTYASSMARFLNRFSKDAKAYGQEKISTLEELMRQFFAAADQFPPDLFITKSGRFSITLFEAVFATVGKKILSGAWPEDGAVDLASVELLRNDQIFLEASQAQSTNKGNVDKRLARAEALIAL